MFEKRPSRLGATAVAAGLLLALAPGSAVFAAPVAKPAGAKKPRLVVFLSVDQMRADYIDDYGHTWTKGLRRLVDQGARFVNARYPYLNTVTCPGHSTLGTGSFPHTHGMVLNGWWDRAQKKTVECTDDPSSALLFYGPGRSSDGDSAKNLMAPTLADEMKSQLNPKPRAVSFSMKARSTIGLVGHSPDALAWLEGGNWVSAKAFSAGLVPWVKKALDQRPREPEAEGNWDRSMPPAAYKYQDDAKEEKAPTGWKQAFPHPLKVVAPAQTGTSATPVSRLSFWEKSPLADAYLGYLGGSAVDALALGKQGSTDFMSLSFSILDIVGHSYGPRSHEVQDVLFRLDATLGTLFDHLDRTVGKDNYVVALSADHGVAVIPEQLKSEGKDAGRVSGTELKKRITDGIVAALGAEAGANPVESVLYTDIYLASGLFDKLRAKPGALEKILETVRGVPGIAGAWGRHEVEDAAKAKDPLTRAAALSYFPGRSGDILTAPKAGWINGSIGTTHGSFNDYDRRVPVIFMGAGIKPGRYDREVTPADVAPTLAQLVGVKMSKAEGQALSEALAPAAEGPANPKKTGKPSAKKKP